MTVLTFVTVIGALIAAIVLAAATAFGVAWKYPRCIAPVPFYAIYMSTMPVYYVAILILAGVPV